MAITPYTGQPLKVGMIVCRRSNMTNGFAGRPVMITRVRGRRLYVRPWGEDGIDASLVYDRSVAYVVDSWDDGNALAQASIGFVKREQERLREFLRGVGDRMADTIEATIKERA